jgi:hypothetical protein
MKERNKIIAPKPNSLNESERLEMAKLLLKAGFTVRTGTEKQGNKSVSFVEYWEEVDKNPRGVI